MYCTNLGCSVIQFVICLSTIALKKLIDIKLEQINKNNLKMSFELNFLDDLSLSTAFQDLSICTYAGYSLITGTFLVSRIIKRNVYLDLNEKLLLSFGSILYFVEGTILLTTLDNIVGEIRILHMCLCGLCYLQSFLFCLHVCLGKKKQTSKYTQTCKRSQIIGESNKTATTRNCGNSKSVLKNNNKVIVTDI